MYKIISDYYIENNQCVDASEFKLDIAQEQVIYEVVRVVNKKVLFQDAHMERLKQSIIATGQQLSLVDDIEQSIKKLIKDHNLNKNIKIDVYNNNFRCYFMESFYPKSELYEQGINTITYSFERDVPTVKKLDMNYKQHIEELKGNLYFEILLEDHLGYIIEGSRSNLVFIKDNKLISAPLSKILNGITFLNIVKLAKEVGVEVEYREIHKDELSSIEACFITGTSIGVLPISSIDNHRYDVNHKLIKQLISLYDAEVY